MSDYVPIACATHERLEFAVLKRRKLRLNCKNGENINQFDVLPLDVYTRDRAEWLHACKVDGSEITLRLDAILEFQEISAV
jgi:Rho-binding antiterminator